jgi:acetyl-CoA carboxylase, biotin carboxylase subunit
MNQHMGRINKLLVANRGEIALRILRSARELGIRTVAVYSDADRQAPFVRFADEAFRLGGPAAAESYLNGDRIIEIARAAGAEAIHPGYGFLSENAVFAEKVEENGLIFIGPAPESIRIMGDKLEAKKALRDFDVPMVPGSLAPMRDIGEARRFADSLGFPVMLKASAGGGGKGMRIVHREEDLEEEMKRAAGEAQAAFGDSTLFMEKCILKPRHIEIQVLADMHGNCVHLFERDCSIQRRHQKLIEEAPSAVLDDALRSRMGMAAVQVAKACHYRGAGTVEFMFDADRNFYFLEMNTRLQVEHPVTELITGLDLVKLQIACAEGQSLPFCQDDLSFRGHAIEVRVNAEDPENAFLPDSGVITHYEVPAGPGIRVDDGYRAGMEVPVYYDPMIAKLIAWGSNREEAIARMVRAVDEYIISGVKTTLSFARFALSHEVFLQARHTTDFVPEHYRTASEPETPGEDRAVVLLSAWLLKRFREGRKPRAAAAKAAGNGWKSRLKP